jgi:hypothetical protein
VRADEVLMARNSIDGKDLNFDVEDDGVVLKVGSTSRTFSAAS